MLSLILTVLGLALVAEGLWIALLPDRLGPLMMVLGRIPPELRRWIGLTELALGVGLLWIARGLLGG